MSLQPIPQAIEQGHGGERLPMPPLEALDAEQRAAAQALIDGPRKAVYGPFASSSLQRSSAISRWCRG